MNRSNTSSIIKERCNQNPVKHGDGDFCKKRLTASSR